jgi:hypothetical protein
MLFHLGDASATAETDLSRLSQPVSSKIMSMVEWSNVDGHVRRIEDGGFAPYCGLRLKTVRVKPATANWQLPTANSFPRLVYSPSLVFPVHKSAIRDPKTNPPTPHHSIIPTLHSSGGNFLSESEYLLFTTDSQVIF